VASLGVAVATADAPYVFGVFGDWGVGKTSALTLLEAKLEQDLSAKRSYDVPIWINVWKFENEANMIYPILYAIKKDYQRRLPGEDMAKSIGREFIKVVGSSLIALTDLGLRAITKKVTGEAIKLEDVQKHLELIEKDVGEAELLLDSWATQVSQLPDFYADFIDKYAERLAKRQGVQPETIRFVFLIDDLDRCMPDTVIAVLERIKNYLSVNRCIYVLGVNQYVVQQAIRAKYGAADVDGREYLEKIVNYAFHVPEPLPDSVKNFALERLNALIPEASDRDQVREHLEAFGQALGESGFLNPRKIKRVLNRYLAFLSRQNMATYAWNTGNIVRLIVVAEYFPTVFRVFWTSPDEAKSELLKLADGTSDFSAFETKHGITLGLARERIAAVRGLFNLQLPFRPNDPDIKAHVAAVAEFTRIR
jgi:hypothetical protein